MKKRIAIIGGGAAGFFAAINIAEAEPDLELHIFEKGNAFLQKVKISGGGRCNITHACFDPAELIQFYPRGNRELLGPFYTFNPGHTIDWFAKKNISIVQEADGRMFPASNDSQTIIDCFLQEAKKRKIILHLQNGVLQIDMQKDATWKLYLQDKTEFSCNNLLVTSGSSHAVWNMLRQIGHHIVPPVASLFTFNIQDERLQHLMGLSVENAECSVIDTRIYTQGPLLITHWGLSGPAILKLSAWAARVLAALQYKFQLKINFIPVYTYQECIELLQSSKKTTSTKTIQSRNVFNLPARLYKAFCKNAGIPEKLTWADISKEQMLALAKNMTQSVFSVQGKSNFKDEFVTSGGILLKEVNFKTMQSKIHPGLFFAGEVLDIDAVTGGFNFQAAWTTAFLAASAIVENNKA